MIGIALLVLNAILAIAAYRKRKVGLIVWLAIIGAAFAFTGKVGFLVLGAIICCLLLGQPLFVLMGFVATLLLMEVSGFKTLDELTIIPRKLLELASKEVLLAIPFFVVAGEIMTQGSLARRLVDAMRAMFGWIPGGLAVSAVMGCVFFAAISGSSPVTVVAIGSIMVPALVKAKYPDGFSIGLLTTAGSLGILIPPSIPMIVYSIMVSASTPVDPIDLFKAGILPGLFIGLLLAMYAVFVGKKLNIPTEPFSIDRVKHALKEGIWSLLLPVIILGGIYSGVFTATEAAAVSVIYALAVELLIHRELDGKKLITVATQSMTVMGALLVIIALATALNYVLTDAGVPDMMVDWLKAQNPSRTSFLILLNLLLLVVGCFMDIMSAILILAPLLAPMSAAVGIHPIHMGIIFIVNLEIGYLTPPVGLNLFVSSTLFKKSLGFVVRAVVPTLFIMLGSLIIITWYPPMSLALVDKGASEEKPVEDVKPVEAPVDAGPKRAKTVQELLQEQMAREADGGTADATPPPTEQPRRAKTVQELLQEQMAKEAAAQQGATDNVMPDAGSTPAP
jgi:C4-dicarboxylate transporter, DctM subunit